MGGNQGRLGLAIAIGQQITQSCRSKSRAQLKRAITDCQEFLHIEKFFFQIYEFINYNLLGTKSA